MHSITSSAASIARKLTDVEHRIGLAVHAGPGAWAIAAIDAKSGNVLAWDGWYFDELTTVETRPLADQPWDDWDDMPSKLLLRGNAAWLGNHLGFWLMPTYSVARNAADLIATHVNNQDAPETARQFSERPVVAYLPVVDEDVLMAHVESLSHDYPSLTAGALPVLREALQ